MPVEIEKNGPVWTVIHNRPEARNAMDPEHAEALCEAMMEFDASDADIAVLTGAEGFFCAGWDLKYAASLSDPEKMEADFAALSFGPGSSPAPRGAPEP